MLTLLFNSRLSQEIAQLSWSTLPGQFDIWYPYSNVDNRGLISVLFQRLLFFARHFCCTTWVRWAFTRSISPQYRALLPASVPNMPLTNASTDARVPKAVGYLNTFPGMTVPMTWNLLISRKMSEKAQLSKYGNTTTTTTTTTTNNDDDDDDDDDTMTIQQQQQLLLLLLLLTMMIRWW